MAERLTVLIEARPFCLFDEEPMNKLREAGLNLIDMRGSGIDDPAFVAALKTADAVLSGNDLVVNDALLKQADRLKAVAKMGVGLDMIDIEAASRHGVLVFNTPGVNDQAVADHTFALILAVARKILYCDRSLREKRWEHTRILGLELWQKTLGLIGLGAIGRNVALRAEGFRMRVVAYDPYWPEQFAAEHNIERVKIDELLSVSDVVSLHVPLMEQTRNLIDAGALSRMKPGAILVNCARGGIVNEADLADALKNQKIAGAGIDVFESEPPGDSPLLELDNVVLTPHTAAFTTQALSNMDWGVVEQLIGYGRGEKPTHAVNPDVFKAPSS
ncbi:MAG: phosphoglycerate dehydrogenase [Desulfobacterales bacterium]|nr:phosphoglycerate dehydrogenase [Desulfobacterales bacterium]